MDIESLMELLYRIGADKETTVFVDDGSGKLLEIDDVCCDEDGSFREIIVIKAK